MSGIDFSGFADSYDESARLCILRCLAEQTDYRLTDSMLDDLMVNRYAINKGRDYVRSQLAWLEHSVGAVKLIRAEHVIIAVLTEAGAEHALMRRVLPGVKRPSAGAR